MRNGPGGRVSLVLPDDTEGLPAPVVAHKCDGTAELHDPVPGSGVTSCALTRRAFQYRTFLAALARASRSPLA